MPADLGPLVSFATAVFAMEEDVTLFDVRRVPNSGCLKFRLFEIQSVRHLVGQRHFLRSIPDL